LFSIYHDLIQLRHEYAALRNSRVNWLHNSDETNLVSYLRADDKDELLVVINVSSHPLTGRVELKNVDNFVPLKITGVQNSSDGPLPMIQLNQYEWRIYHRASIPMHPAPGVAVSGN
jgi:glycosidase